MGWVINIVSSEVLSYLWPCNLSKVSWQPHRRFHRNDGLRGKAILSGFSLKSVTYQENYHVNWHNFTNNLNYYADRSHSSMAAQPGMGLWTQRRAWADIDYLVSLGVDGRHLAVD